MQLWMQVMLVLQEQLYLLPCRIQTSEVRLIPFICIFPMNFSDINSFARIWM